LAFSSHIAPTTDTPRRTIPIPKYARKMGFTYDLSSLRSGGKTPANRLDLVPITIGDHFSESAVPDVLVEQTTLDQGQAVALYENLNRELAFTQGPPGTGKTSLLHHSRHT
jgi:hypothetical protein